MAASIIPLPLTRNPLQAGTDGSHGPTVGLISAAGGLLYQQLLEKGGERVPEGRAYILSVAGHDTEPVPGQVSATKPSSDNVVVSMAQGYHAPNFTLCEECDHVCIIELPIGARTITKSIMPQVHMQIMI